MTTGQLRVLQGYIDADYAGDLDQRRSIMGYVFTVAESIVSWKVELQNTVALSTTKAEYMAAVEAFKEALRLRELVGTFRIIKDSIQIYYISQSVIHLAKDHMYHNRTKHIDVKYHRICQ